MLTFLREISMNLFKTFGIISQKSKRDHVGAYASEAALFIIMSFVPFIIMLMTLVKSTPLTEDIVISFINNIAPTAFIAPVNSIVHEMYIKVDPAVVFLAIFAVLWAAGKGFVSLIEGLNSVFAIKEHRNWIKLRLYAILYTIVFMFIIILCVVIYILGYRLHDFFYNHVPFIAKIIGVILQFRALIVITLLSLLFTFLYVAIPNRHTKIKRQIPGAIFAAIGWTGFSFFFSLYVKYSSNLSILYGSLTTLICVMLWLYVCMYIFLVGAEVNVYVEQLEAEKSSENAIDITHTHS